MSSDSLLTLGRGSEEKNKTMIPNGKCQGCDAYGETDDISLCEDCADELEEQDLKL